MQELQIIANGFEWFYREEVPQTPNGKPPVVLLHGLVSQSYGWRNTLPALAEQGFRAIAPDWLGSGFSAKPERREFAYSPEAFGQALGDWLDAMELPLVSIVAQGYLGSVGVQYAMGHPDRVARLAILNAPIFAGAKVPFRVQQMGWPGVGDMITQDPLLVDRTLEGGGGYRVEDADLDVYRRPFLKSSEAGRALKATVQQLQLKRIGAELEAGLKTWPKPLLLAWGDRDPWLPLASVQSLAQGLKNVKLDTLIEAGHYPQEDWHEKVNASLLSFLRAMDVV
jgi:pimeloyl-ACP methyl ester carboxylesterase